MFRTLKRDVNGPDVAQLQALLRSLGYFTGRADGRFGPATEAAVKRWQRVIGAAAHGIVEPGDLSFLDQLPARAAVIPAVGERVDVGSPLLRVFAARPTSRALVSAAFRSELASGMAVDIQGAVGTRWQGVLGTFRALADGRFEVDIASDVCADRCTAIPVDGETSLEGTVVLVPETRGPVVPTSALVQGASGSVAVVLADGTTREVRVIAQANGFAVVDGLAPGTTVRLPAPPGP